MYRRLTCIPSYVFAAPWVACESSPCDNGGTCVDVNVDTFICVCKDDHFGITCNQSKFIEHYLVLLIENETISI